MLQITFNYFQTLPGIAGIVIFIKHTELRFFDKNWGIVLSFYKSNRISVSLSVCLYRRISLTVWLLWFFYIEASHRSREYLERATPPSQKSPFKKNLNYPTPNPPTKKIKHSISYIFLYLYNFKTLIIIQVNDHCSIPNPITKSG